MKNSEKKYMVGVGVYVIAILFGISAIIASDPIDVIFSSAIAAIFLFIAIIKINEAKSEEYTEARKKETEKEITRDCIFKPHHYSKFGVEFDVFYKKEKIGVIYSDMIKLDEGYSSKEKAGCWRIFKK